MLNIDLLEASDRIARLSDDVVLNEEEAAIFLRVSMRTMQRMRGPDYIKDKKNLGPNYIQASGKGLRGSNQKVTYKLGDLKAWQRGNTVGSTVEAAIRKGQAFTSIHDAFNEPAPFWKNENGLMGRVFDSAEDEFFERVGIVEIVWLLPFDAAIEEWSDATAHKAFADKTLALLDHAKNHVLSSVEKSELKVFVEPQPKRGAQRDL